MSTQPSSVANMSETASAEIKTPQEVSKMGDNGDEHLKTVMDRHNKAVVLVPQPSDDPEDPLVCWSRLLLPLLLLPQQETSGFLN